MNKKLTGNARFATLVVGGDDGKKPESFLILEVEEKYDVMDSIGGYVDFQTHTRWRVASVRDITKMELEL